jgi:hypothetical protein
MVKIIDNEMGADSAMGIKEYMKIASNFEKEKNFITFAGYSHLLLAEKMVEKKYSKEDINFELDKAVALLDLANRGGNHPLLPRAMKLKRKINLRSYIKLVISCVSIAGLILLSAGLYRFIMDNYETIML